MFFKAFFKASSKPPVAPPMRNVVYPFRPLIQAMAEKDPVLFDEISPLLPSAAAQRWREVYPEDFPGDLPIINQKHSV